VAEWPKAAVLKTVECNSSQQLRAEFGPQTVRQNAQRFRPSKASPKGENAIKRFQSIPTEHVAKIFNIPAGIFVYGSSGGNENPHQTALAHPCASLH